MRKTFEYACPSCNRGDADEKPTSSIYLRTGVSLTFIEIPPGMQPRSTFIPVHHTSNNNSTHTHTNGMISGISPSLRVLRISWAHSACYPPPTASDRTPPTPASAGSLRTRPHISDSRPRWTLRWLGGWRRSGRFGRRLRRGRGCRRWRTCRGRR